MMTYSISDFGRMLADDIRMESYIEAMKDLLQLESISLPFLLFALALTPAICEEVLFRGALLSGLRKRLPLWALMIVIGLLFGIAHLSVYKVVATGLSGALLAYLVWRTGSIFSSMIVHFSLNAGALLLERGKLFPAAVYEVVQKAEEQGANLPFMWLLGGLVLLIVGIAAMEWQGRRHSTVQGNATTVSKRNNRSDAGL